MNRAREVLVCILVVTLLSSCDFIQLIRQEQPVVFQVPNLYKDFDMSVFNDFFDKMPLQEMIAIHGKPDTIMDAANVAMIEDYIIYEYYFEDGNIDCYVRKDVPLTSANIDYIYYEPHKRMKLSDILINDSLRNLISNYQSRVFYITDQFQNIVRFRLEKDNSNEVLNVALNDVTSFMGISLSAFSNKINSEPPLILENFGLIEKLKDNGNEIQIDLRFTEREDLNVQKLIKSKPNWDIVLTKRLFLGLGPFRYINGEILGKKRSLRLILHGDITGQKEEALIDNDALKQLLKNGSSNKEILSDYISFENLSLPQQITEWLYCDTMRIDDNKLIHLLKLYGTMDDYELNASLWKQHALNLISDSNNPSRIYIMLCAKCGYGIKEIYRFANSEEQIEVSFSEEETKELLSKI